MYKDFKILLVSVKLTFLSFIICINTSLINSYDLLHKYFINIFLQYVNKIPLFNFLLNVIFCTFKTSWKY